MRARGLVVVAATLLMMAAGAGAASAREVVLHDPAGDVWRTSFSGDDVRPAPRTRVGDVRRASFSHGPRSIVVRQRFTELRRVGGYSLHVVRLENGSHISREVRVEAAPGSWRGTAKVFDRRGNRVTCRVRHALDYDRNILRVRVPRSCLGKPAMVRASASSYWADRRAQVFFSDNPHNERAETRTWTRWLRSGR